MPRSLFVVVALMVSLAPWPCASAGEPSFDHPQIVPGGPWHPGEAAAAGGVGAGWFGGLGDEESALLYARALDLMGAGQLGTAAQSLARLAASSRYRLREVMLCLSRCHLDLGNPRRALEWLEERSKRFGDDYDGLLLLGMARCAVGDATAAVALLEPLRWRVPADPEVHFQLALAYDALDKPNLVVEHAQKAVQLDASYKKRLQPLIKNSKVARRIGSIITDVLRETESSQLSDEQIDEYARRVNEILGMENIAPTTGAATDVHERLRRALNVPPEFRGFRPRGSAPAGAATTAAPSGSSPGAPAR